MTDWMRSGNESELGAGALICLIHGTFAKNAAWIKADSLFCNNLKSRLPRADLLSFTWSGWNSHSSRLAASEQLAVQIEARLLSGATNRVYFIGHSHGGNVALLAMRSPTLVQAARGMVFLGTPFLSVEARSWIGSTYIFARIGALIALTVTGLAIGFLAGFALNAAGFSDVRVAVGLTFLFLMLKGEDLYESVRDWLEVELETRLEFAGQDATMLAQTSAPPCPTFVATVAADEAGRLLNVVDSATTAPVNLLRLIGESLLSAFGGLLAGGFVLSLVNERLIEESPAIAWVGVPVVIAALLFFFLLIPLALLVSVIRGSPVAFGGETPALVLSARIRPSPLPPWKDAPGSVRRGWPRDVESSLRHSFFYSSNDVILAVADWLEARERRRGERPSGATPMPVADAAMKQNRWTVRVLPGLVVALAMLAIGAAG